MAFFWEILKVSYWRTISYVSWAVKTGLSQMLRHPVHRAGVKKKWRAKSLAIGWGTEVPGRLLGSELGSLGTWSKPASASLIAPSTACSAAWSSVICTNKETLIHANAVRKLPSSMLWVADEPSLLPSHGAPVLMSTCPQAQPLFLNSSSQGAEMFNSSIPKCL